MYFIFKYIYVILIDSPDLLFTAKLRAQCHVSDKETFGGLHQSQISGSKTKCYVLN